MKAPCWFHSHFNANVVANGTSAANRFHPRRRYITEAGALLAFLSARELGFSIWNEHMRFSSTLIMAPALSNSPQ
jgi:hypothetical protein